MKPFNLYLPVRYYFGFNLWEEKLKDFLPLLGDRILLVTGKNFAKKYGYAYKIIELCKNKGSNCIWYNDISPNPKTYEIEKGGEIAKKEKITGLLGFGGGSVMDATKAISILAKNKGNIWEYTMMQKSPQEVLPFGLIPTTPATGSEINSTSIISNVSEKRKWGIFDEKIFPSFSIVDPSLSETLDRDYLSLCSIDIITHVLEPFVTGRENAEVIKGVAKFYIKKVIEEVKILRKEPKNKKARENMHLLSGLALSGIATRGTGGFHEMHWLEHIVSGFFDNVPHPAGLSILLIPWLKYRLNKNENNIKELFSYLMDKENVSKEEIFEYLDNFYEEINLPRSFKEYGIKEDNIEDFIREYRFLSDKFPRFFVEKIEEKDLLKIFEEALK